MKTTIYALTDPAVFYVGRTIQPLEQRLRQHIDIARRNKSDCARAEHIRELLAQKKTPGILALEQVSLEEASQAEGRWIASYCESGIVLTNEQSHNVGGSRSYIIEWTPDKLARLGKESDSTLAEEWQIDRKTVEYKRKRLGIPRKPQTNFVIPSMGGWNRHEWSSEVIARFGTLPDYQLAQELGIDKSIISRARKRLGIASYAEQHGNPSQYKQGHRPTRWSKREGGDAHACSFS